MKYRFNVIDIAFIAYLAWTLFLISKLGLGYKYLPMNIMLGVIFIGIRLKDMKRGR